MGIGKNIFACIDLSFDLSEGHMKQKTVFSETVCVESAKFARYIKHLNLLTLVDKNYDQWLIGPFIALIHLT